MLNVNKLFIYHKYTNPLINKHIQLTHSEPLNNMVHMDQFYLGTNKPSFMVDRANLICKLHVVRYVLFGINKTKGKTCQDLCCGFIVHYSITLICVKTCLIFTVAYSKPASSLTSQLTVLNPYFQLRSNQEQVIIHLKIISILLYARIRKNKMKQILSIHISKPKFIQL